MICWERLNSGRRVNQGIRGNEGEAIVPFYNKAVNLEPKLIKLVRSRAAGLIGTVFFGLAAGLLVIAQARLLSGMIAGAFLRGQGIAELRGGLAALLGVILVRAVAGYLGDWNAAGLAGQIKVELRERLFSHLQRMGPAGLSRRPAGDLTATLLQGVDMLEAYFSQFLPQAALAGLIPLGVLLFVFPLDPLSGTILLVTGPLIPWFMFLIGSNAEKLTSSQFRALRRMSATLLDILQGLKTLKALGRSREQAERIAAVSAKYRDTTMEVLRVTFLSALALELLGTISTAVIAVQVGLRLLYGQLAFEQAFFLLVIAPDFYLPLRTLGLRFHASMQGVTAARQIFGLLDTPVYMPAEPIEAQSIPSDWETIEFQGVRYQYADREEAALDGIDLRIRKGEFTALVGDSGAGKSTTAGLLLRFLTAQSGKIRIGGVDLRQVRAKDWQEMAAWVPQRPYLFNATLGENLRIAKTTASDEELWQVLEMARLKEYAIRLPKGLETPLNERGGRLSSGQAQRLALARAFLREAPLLVLDEPTAHLDPDEASLLEETLRRLCRGRTVLAIAHRLETVIQADQIVLMAGGRILESGTHARLLAMGNAYARLVQDYGARR
jgi:ATP-binding cassette, subfamily C, bacterial CydD